MRNMVQYTLVAQFVVDDPNEAKQYEDELKGTGARVIVEGAGEGDATNGVVREAIVRSGVADADSISSEHRLVTIVASGQRADSQDFDSAVDAIRRASA